MEKNEKVAEVLNDLIEINNDRVNGYERAAKETATEDADLRSLFNDMGNESKIYLQDLKNQVKKFGEEPAKGTTTSGKIYRVWMDVKATFSGHGRRAILASCEFGEDAAQKAYQMALEVDDLPAEIRQLISDQKSRLRRSHDKIKSMRDAQTA